MWSSLCAVMYFMFVCCHLQTSLCLSNRSIDDYAPLMGVPGTFPYVIPWRAPFTITRLSLDQQFWFESIQAGLVACFHPWISKFASKLSFAFSELECEIIHPLWSFSSDHLSKIVLCLFFILLIIPYSLYRWIRKPGRAFIWLILSIYFYLHPQIFHAYGLFQVNSCPYPWAHHDRIVPPVFPVAPLPKQMPFLWPAPFADPVPCQEPIPQLPVYTVPVASLYPERNFLPVAEVSTTFRVGNGSSTKVLVEEPPPIFEAPEQPFSPPYATANGYTSHTPVVMKYVIGTPSTIREVNAGVTGDPVLASLFMDTGSDVSLIKMDLLPLLGVTEEDLLPSSCIVSGEYDGASSHRLLGDLYLKINLVNGASFTTLFHVTPFGRHNLILGRSACEIIQPMLLGTKLTGTTRLPSPPSDFHMDVEYMGIFHSTLPAPTTSVTVSSTSALSGASAAVLPPFVSVARLPPQLVEIPDQWMPARTTKDTFTRGRGGYIVDLEVPNTPSEFLPLPTMVQDSYAALPVTSHLPELKRGSDTSSGPLVRTKRLTTLVACISADPLLLPKQTLVGYYKPLKVSEYPEFTQAFCASTDSESVSDPGEYLANQAVPAPISEAENVKMIQEAIEKQGTEIENDKDRSLLRTLLWKWKNVFSANMGPANIPPVHLHTTTDAPLYQAPRHLNPSMQQELQKILDPMIKDDVIAPATQFDITSPIVMVKKKNGEFRMCVDFRKLNERLVPDNYPLPLIKDLHDSMAGAKWFSTLDLKSGFWQIPIHQEDQHKLTFVVPNGTYTFKVMPFGLSTAPSIFQRTMNSILGDLKFEYALTYIDDIIIYSKTFTDHLQHLDSVLSRFAKVNLRAGMSKCHFAQRTVHYLGHVVSEHGIEPDEAHVEEIKKWEHPTDVHGVRSFVSMCSYYRDFILHFADIAEPLNALTRKTVPWHWGETEQKAFDELKLRLIRSPVLAFPQFDRPFILGTDASKVALGSVIEQYDDNGKLHPIAYYSRTLNAAERNYTTSELECLSLVESIKHFDFYLTHTHFVVFTDHSALQALKKSGKEMNSPRLARWQLILQAYDCEIFHRSGLINIVPDVLSRKGKPDKNFDRPNILPSANEPAPLPVSTADVRFDNNGACANMPGKNNILTTELTAGISAIKAQDQLEANQDWNNASFLLQIKLAQRKDKELIPLITFLEKGTLSSDPKIAQAVMARALHATMVKGILVHHISETDENLQIFLPHGAIRDRIIWRFHEHPFEGAHQNFHKTYERLARRFYFKGMYSYTQHLIATCRICQVAKSSHLKPAAAPMSPTIVPLPMEKVAMDFVGPVVKSNHLNSWILVITDYCTKWAEIYPLRDARAPEVAACLADWCCRYGAPLSLVSDRGKNFLAEIIQNFCAIWDIDRNITSSYHPQANSQVERLNGTLCDMIRAFATETGTRWDEHLGAAMFAYRNAIHSTTHFSPAQLLFGYTLHTPLDAEMDRYLRLHKKDAYDTDFIFSHAQALERSREIARRFMEKQAWTSAQEFNAHHRLVQFNNGEIVWLKNHHRANKFAPFWVGPFRINQVNRNGSYHLIDVTGNQHPSPVNAADLKRAIYDKDRSFEDQFLLEAGSGLVEPESSSSTSSSSSSSFFSTITPNPPLNAPSQSSVSWSSAAHSSSIPSLDDVKVNDVEPQLKSVDEIEHLITSSVPSHELKEDFSYPTILRTDFNIIPGPMTKNSVSRPFAVNQWGVYTGLEPPEGNEKEEYEVDRILGVQIRRRKRYYLVQWTSYVDPTWEPIENLTHAQAALAEFNDLLTPPTQEQLHAQRINPSQIKVFLPNLSQAEVEEEPVEKELFHQGQQLADLVETNELLPKSHTHYPTVVNQPENQLTKNAREERYQRRQLMKEKKSSQSSSSLKSEFSSLPTLDSSSSSSSSTLNSEPESQIIFRADTTVPPMVIRDSSESSQSTGVALSESLDGATTLILPTEQNELETIEEQEEITELQKQESNLNENPKPASSSSRVCDLDLQAIQKNNHEDLVYLPRFSSNPSDIRKLLLEAAQKQQEPSSSSSLESNSRSNSSPRTNLSSSSSTSSSADSSSSSSSFSESLLSSNENGMLSSSNSMSTSLQEHKRVMPSRRVTRRTHTAHDDTFATTLSPTFISRHPRIARDLLSSKQLQSQPQRKTQQ